MISVSRIVDICIFVGGLSVIAFILLAWVANDPKAHKTERLSTSSWVLVVPLSCLAVSGNLGTATCVLSGAMSGHGMCKVQFKRGLPLDPVSDFVGIQVFYGVLLLAFVSFGALLAVGIYRKLRAR